MKEIFENIHWYIKGFGAGERFIEARVMSNVRVEEPPLIKPPKQSNQCWIEWFRDAIEMFKQ